MPTGCGQAGPCLACNDGKVSDPMSKIRDAKARLDAAEKEAAAMVFNARAELGRAILDAQGDLRRRNAPDRVAQKAIAIELGVSRETIRQYQEAARKAAGES